MTSFAQCAEAFRLSRVAKAPSRPAAWFPHGTAYHHAIEEYELSGRRHSKELLELLFIDHYRNEIAKLKEQHPEESDWMTGGRKKGWNDVEDREKIGVWQVHDYVDFAEATKDLWRIHRLSNGDYACEVKFDIKLGNVNATGFIDQLREYPDGSLAPADLKTGTKKPASTMQLGVYAEAVEQLFGVRPQIGMFVKAGRPETKAKPAEHTADQMHSLEEWTTPFLTELFTAMDRMDKQGLFLPNPQEGCERTCGVAEFCRIKGWGETRKELASINSRPRKPRLSDDDIAAILAELEAADYAA